MAITNGYLTLLEFKNYKGGTGVFGSDTSDDAVIEALIEGASRFIDNMTGKVFFSDTGTRYYSPEFADTIFIDNITTLTTLKTDDNLDGTFENTWNTGQSTGDFWLMPLNAVEKGIPFSWIEVNPDGDYSFTKGRKTVEISGTWGYSSVPTEIKNACYEIVNAAFGRRSGQNITGNAEVTAAGIVITPEDITAYARKILQMHTRGYQWE